TPHALSRALNPPLNAPSSTERSAAPTDGCAVAPRTTPWVGGSWLPACSANRTCPARKRIIVTCAPPAVVTERSSIATPVARVLTGVHPGSAGDVVVVTGGGDVVLGGATGAPDTVG